MFVEIAIDNQVVIIEVPTNRHEELFRFKVCRLYYMVKYEYGDLDLSILLVGK